MQNKQIILTAIQSDPTIEPEQRKRLLAALEEKPFKPPKRISIKRTAEILECCEMTVRRLEKRGYLHPIRMSARRIRYREDEVLDLARNGIQQM